MNAENGKKGRDRVLNGEPAASAQTSAEAGAPSRLPAGVDPRVWHDNVKAAAARALAEAQARRASSESGKPHGREREIGGPKGPEPTRYGDWERNGIVSDF